TEDVPPAGEVEVGVLREIDDGGPVRGRGVVEAESVVVGEGIHRADGKRPGVSLLEVRTHIAEFKGRTLRGLPGLGGPDTLVKPPDPAVEMVRAVVRREGPRFAVEHEPSLGDAVAVTPDQATEVGRVPEVSPKLVVAEHHILEPPFAVGDPKR